MKNKIEKKPVSKLSFLESPTTKIKEEEGFTLYNYITFKNIVISFGLVTFSMFLISVSTIETTLLSISIIVMLTYIVYETYMRRQWEENTTEKFDTINSEYERLAREVARNRSDGEIVRQRISEAAGDFVTNYDKTVTSIDVEGRILKALAMKLATLCDIQKIRANDDDIVIDPAIAEKKASLKGISDIEVGRRLRDDQVVQLLNAALKRDRIDLFLQPIVALPQRKVRFYETFARIRVMSGIYLPASRYIDLALQHNMIPTIDNMLLIRGVQEVRKAIREDSNCAYFFNINSTTLNDSKFMTDLVEFISQNRMLAPKIIFEMGQKDLHTMSPDVYPALDGLAKLGCRFSMDMIENLALDFKYLEQRHIRFIKVRARSLLARLKKDGGSIKLRSLKDQLDMNGIDLIVEKVENERHLIDLLDLDIDYGQGYLFGKPDLSKYYQVGNKQ